MAAEGAPKRVRVKGSRRFARGSTFVREPDSRRRLTVYVHLRNPSRQQPPDGSAADLKELSIPKARRAIADRRSKEYAVAAQAIRSFAGMHGLHVRRVDLTRRIITLSGTAAQLAAAFGATLAVRRTGRAEFVFRTGYVTIPEEIAHWTRAVLGFEEHPLPGRQMAGLAQNGQGDGLWPSAVASLYGFPAGIDAAGRTVGILALGGGYLKSDLEAACAGMGLPVPEISERSIAGATNEPISGSLADEELALDMQAVAGIALGARIVVYFAPNSIDKIALAVSVAALDTVNKPDVLSISWGSAERFWPADVVDATRAALRDATRVGVSVVAAAGDALATCGLTDQAAHVCFPASSPYVLGCGGTQIDLTDGALSDERVWNEFPAGTGGGISALFPDVPDYQSAVPLPPSYNGGVAGRGVPDVAAAAGGSPGYRIVLAGQELVKSGTSAVAPFWAAIIAGMSRSRGARLGMLHPLLYGDRSPFRDITVGNNNVGDIGYAAAAGWNACTGLGAPQGKHIQANLFR